MNQAIELIDADAHVNPPPTFWDDYLPAQFADARAEDRSRRGR